MTSYLPTLKKQMEDPDFQNEIPKKLLRKIERDSEKLDIMIQNDEDCQASVLTDKDRFLKRLKADSRHQSQKILEKYGEVDVIQNLKKGRIGNKEARKSKQDVKQIKMMKLSESQKKVIKGTDYTEDGKSPILKDVDMSLDSIEKNGLQGG